MSMPRATAPGAALRPRPSSGSTGRVSGTRSCAAATTSPRRLQERLWQRRPMARTVIAFVAGALVLAAGWIRLEHGDGDTATAAALMLLALAPALVRPSWLRAPALVASALAAVNLAFGGAALSAATV